MALTYRIETDPATDRPVAWIDSDGYPVIRQPHHPNAPLDPADPLVGLWGDAAEAEAWAVSQIAAIEAEQAAAVAEAAAVEEDRARLVRIEEMLTQLLGNA